MNVPCTAVPFDAYVWLAFACVSGEALKMPADQVTAPFAVVGDAPMLVFKHATCPVIDTKALKAIATVPSVAVDICRSDGSPGIVCVGPKSAPGSAVRIETFSPVNPSI